MIILLHILKNINTGRIDDNIPPMQGGSREVHQVYTSFAKLYKIVRVSNSVFYSGNLKLAYHFVLDAHKLFLKVDDKKALAIASNNLGNTLLAIKCENAMKELSCCVKVESVCCAETALLHFNLAVKSATEEYKMYENMDTKIRFAQQLANRLFNRGLFYVLTRDDPCTPDNAYELGYQDLVRAQELDNHVNQCWIEMDVVLANADNLFDRSIRRLHGLAAMHNHSDILKIWDIKTLTQDCHRLLIAAWNEAPSSLYQEINHIGRLQQLEGAIIRLELHRGNILVAAHLSMRMLAQDEFLNEISFVYAAEALFQFMAKKDPRPICSWSALTKMMVKCDLRRMLNSCKQKVSTGGKTVYFCIDIGNELLNHDSKGREEIEEFCLLMYDAYCLREDYVGLTASSPDSPHGPLISVSLECKGKHQSERRQRSALEVAIRNMSDSHLRLTRQHSAVSDLEDIKTHVLEYAMDSISKSDVSYKQDTYILYVTNQWEQTHDAAPLLWIQEQIRNFNKTQNNNIHISIVNIESGVASDTGMTLPAPFQKLCDVSHQSSYVSARMGRLVEALDKVTSSIPMGSTSSNINNVLSGVTMEKF